MQPHRITPEQESLDRSKATGTSRFLRGQLIRVTVRVENLRVIQLSKTSQVTAHRATLSLRHRGQQNRVRVSNAVVAARCRIAKFRLVIIGNMVKLIGENLSLGRFLGQRRNNADATGGNTAKRTYGDHRKSLRSSGCDTSKLPKS